VLNFISSLPTAQIIPYEIYRTDVYNDTTVKTRHDFHIFANLDGLMQLKESDCDDKIMLTLDFEYPDPEGWQTLWAMHNENVDEGIVTELLHSSPIVLYTENDLLKVSLDIPESWFNSELAMKFATDDAQITVNARIAVRNLEGDIIEVNN
jgi:hypothetical protein